MLNKSGLAHESEPKVNAFSSRQFFQPKTVGNTPGGVYEQETNAMADGVMNMHPPASQSFFGPAITPVQRKCSGCKEEDKMLHRKESAGSETQTENLACKFISKSPSGERFHFIVNTDKFAFGEEEKLNNYLKLLPAGAEISVLGMASAEGPSVQNEKLSCDRALKAAKIVQKSGKTLREVEATGGYWGSDHNSNFRAVSIAAKNMSPSPQMPVSPQIPDKPTPEQPQPIGPVKPAGTPGTYCVPFTSQLQAVEEYLDTKAIMYGYTKAFGSDVHDLWMTYLNTPKVGTRGILPPRKKFDDPRTRIVREFRDDDETKTQKELIMDRIANRIRMDRSIMPSLGQSTPPMSFRSILSGDFDHLPMSFKDGAYKIPGNIAGGFGNAASDAGPDVRSVDGTFTATNIGEGPFNLVPNLRLHVNLTFDVKDCIDFCPGNPGGWAAQQVTVSMSRFEATPNFPTYDTPFEVVYEVSDTKDYKS